MNTLAFDSRMGASGDMLLGSLVAVGADPGVLEPVEAALEVEYAVGTVTKNGIAATTVDVVRPATGDQATDGEHDHRGDEDHPGDDHDHHCDDDDRGDDHHHDDHHHDDHHHDDHHHDDHHHDDAHDHRERVEGSGPHRSYAEVVELVEGMGLPAAIESDALATFRLLGEAEAAIHDTDLEATHFHEVGADDAVADVVGAFLLLADLGVDRVVTTPLSAGGGEASMSHGAYPVPAPAVVELAERADWSLRGGPVDRELLTPTGAAILARAADGVDHLPPLRVRESGYGAGDADVPERPNVLRAVVGDGGGRLRREGITVLETNLDDATPEAIGGLQETLVDAGALDVSVLPTTMKKSRPGHLVKVVVDPADAERVAARLAAETGTLGVRESGARHRWVADRDVETAAVEVDDESFAVAVKVASTADGEVYDVSAEFDDALAVAEATGLPVREVMRRAESAVRDA